MKIIQRCVLISLAWAALCAASAAGPQYTLTTLASFNALTNGSTPFAGLVADAAGNLYGTAHDGGAGNSGTVFKVANDANHSLSVLAIFNGTNGAGSHAGLIADAAGNLYGTTETGGISGNGTVFKVANDANHTLSTLVSFNGTNGANPYAGLITDAAGNLYGTTIHGGTNNNGTVFEVANDANHTFTTLTSFNGTNLTGPFAGLIADAAGNLYSTTINGGSGLYGTVFEVANDANHTLSILASFNLTNGAAPGGGLISDSAGNLYGTTTGGGTSNSGTVFKVANDANHTLSTLATFNGTNGAAPWDGLITDAAGNLYGTTQTGGVSNRGTVFEMANDASHTLTTLVSFNRTNGQYPYGGLIADSAGNLYGTTSSGGANGYGTVFELSPVPEPPALVLALAGLGGALLFVRRRNRHR